MGKRARPLLANQYLTKCQAANKAGKFAEAVDMAGKALEYNPNNANAYKLRGNAYVSLNKMPEAIADFEKYLEVNPNAKDAESIKKTIAQLKAAKK
jgi:tetratricopeptide (TPR) repeat protein